MKNWYEFHKKGAVMYFEEMKFIEQLQFKDSGIVVQFSSH